MGGAGVFVIRMRLIIIMKVGLTVQGSMAVLTNALVYIFILRAFAEGTLS